MCGCMIIRPGSIDDSNAAIGSSVSTDSGYANFADFSDYSCIINTEVDATTLSTFNNDVGALR